MKPGDQQLATLRPTGETSTDILKAGKLAKVVNLRNNHEGGLVTVRAPRPFFTAQTVTPPDNFEVLVNPTAVAYFEVERGNKKRVVVRDDDLFKVLDVANETWVPLVGDHPDATIQTQLMEEALSGWPTQFVRTSRGVVMVDPNGPSYFYDGTYVGPLGFSEVPGAPNGMGPSSSSTEGTVTGSTAGEAWTSGTNDIGYVADGLQGWEHSTQNAHKGGRLGTVDIDQGVRVAGGTVPSSGDGVTPGGALLQGRYRCKQQYIDRWGNLSASSPASDDVVFDFQFALNSTQRQLDPNPQTLSWARPDLVRKKVVWDVSTGPYNAIGRVLMRTKDLENSGDASMYELPNDAAGSRNAYATLPDNVTRLYPDNIPDAWLVTPGRETEPTPQFRRAVWAFDRLWVINLSEDPGALMISEVGLPGTFAKGSRRYPDARGGELTGIVATAQGVLVFTETSTYMYSSNDQGTDFIRTTLSTTVGCTSPASATTMSNGITVWLGLDGFYGFSGGDVEFLWSEHRSLALEHNAALLRRAHAVYDPTSREYRCWVAAKGNTRPQRCYVFDGASWRWRTDTVARASWVIGKHVVVAGRYNNSPNLWVLDVGGKANVTTAIDSGWISHSGYERRTYRKVAVRLRETYYTGPGSSDDVLTLTTYRDYRAESTGTDTNKLLPEQVAREASVWGQDTFGDLSLRERRPYWVTFDIQVEATEAVRFTLTTPGQVEVLDIVTVFTPKEYTPGRTY